MFIVFVVTTCKVCFQKNGKGWCPFQEEARESRPWPFLFPHQDPTKKPALNQILNQTKISSPHQTPPPPQFFRPKTPQIPKATQKGTQITQLIKPKQQKVPQPVTETSGSQFNCEPDLLIIARLSACSYRCEQLPCGYKSGYTTGTTKIIVPALMQTIHPNKSLWQH